MTWDAEGWAADTVTGTSGFGPVQARAYSRPVDSKFRHERRHGIRRLGVEESQRHVCGPNVTDLRSGCFLDSTTDQRSGGGAHARTLSPWGATGHGEISNIEANRG